MIRPLVVLGATGSIGRQTMEVAARLGIPIVALAARRGSDQLAVVARSWPDAEVVVTSPTSSERQQFQEEFGDRVRIGPEAMDEVAGKPGQVVVNGVVGAAGLSASVAALRAGNRLALANKESLVAGGPVVKATWMAGGGELIPVDSEHSALHQCLIGEDPKAVSRLILTASGGPFRGRSPEELATVTPAEALRHPNWDMGPRITVDSATLFNKGLEVIEAHFLFDLPYDVIEVVIHPQSVIHSLVEFRDGSVKAQLGDPDMRLPIQYAITAPERLPGPAPPFRLGERTLNFEPADRAAFPALDLAYAAGRSGGSAPAVLNAADEIAVQAFLEGRLGFTGIPAVVERALEQVEWRELTTVEDVMAVDREARSVARAAIGGSC